MEMFPNSKWYLFWKYILACKINEETEVVRSSHASPVFWMLRQRDPGFEASGATY